MRVAHVAPTRFGRGGLLGGGERYPLELARALAPLVETELLIIGDRAEIAREPGGLRVRTLPAVGYLWQHPAHGVAPALVGALGHADLVHTHHLRSTPSRLAAVTAYLRRVPAVVTDHGLSGSDWAAVLPRLFHRFLMVSAYSARVLRAPPARTRVIYGGADPVRYAPSDADPRRGVLFVGRLTPHKGVDRLISALPRQAHLSIVGSAGHDRLPPESEYPSLLQRLAVDRDVSFHHALPDAELPRAYRSAQLLVLPSVEQTCYGRRVGISELLGLVLLEAMASGTPVIASRLGGLPEVVQDGVTGYLVEPGNVRELHDRLAELLGDPARARRFGRAARELVCARFTWQHCAERCLAAYEELASPVGTGEARLRRAGTGHGA
ncbi:MAG: glycosyltransferase family 4 protein, partial [Chloroflexi bacterium]|nr:glycosyltransferase family 4 protein [Chloroflexota bacterium]